MSVSNGAPEQEVAQMLRSSLAATAASLLMLVLPASAEAGERVVRLDPASTRISFDLKATGHDVHGELFLQEGEVRFDPETGKASGTISVDALRAETGNKKRDKTMHKKVLESEQFPLFRFTANHIDGMLADAGTSLLELKGTMTVHGEDHPFTMPTTVTVSGDRFQATTTFAIPYVEWGMRNPSILFLRVAKVVDVKVETEGTLAGGNGASHAVGAD
jgi:polyisoprenoid-binding protein YceI